MLSRCFFSFKFVRGVNSHLLENVVAKPAPTIEMCIVTRLRLEDNDLPTVRSLLLIDIAFTSQHRVVGYLASPVCRRKGQCLREVRLSVRIIRVIVKITCLLLCKFDTACVCRRDNRCILRRSSGKTVFAVTDNTSWKSSSDAT